MEVDQDIDFLGANGAGRSFIIHVRNIRHAVHGRENTLSQGGTVFATPAKSMNFEAGAIVECKKFSCQQAHGM